MPMPLSRRVAARIARLLEDRGMSGRALSRATGIPQKSLSRKLSGETAFDLDDLPLVADALGVKIPELLSH